LIDFFDEAFRFTRASAVRGGRKMMFEKTELEGGKYAICRTESEIYALRHGERWRDLTGDKLVVSMLAEIGELRELLERFRDFATNNATQWKPGSNHLNPIWQEVANAIVKTTGAAS
jgi:hypothetical protein